MMESYEIISNSMLTAINIDDIKYINYNPTINGEENNWYNKTLVDEIMEKQRSIHQSIYYTIRLQMDHI